MRKSGLFHFILCSAFYKAEISRASSPFLVASEASRAKEHVTSCGSPLWGTCSRDRWIPVLYEWTNIRVHECRRALVHEMEQNEKDMKVVYLEVNQQRNYCLANSMISNRLHFNLVLENEWSSINEKWLVIFKLIDAVMSMVNLHISLCSCCNKPIPFQILKILSDPTNTFLKRGGCSRIRNCAKVILLNMVNFSLEVTLNEDDLKCLKMSIVIRLNILNMMAFF